MKQFAIILISAVLLNNYVLSRFLGICPFLGVSKKLDSAFGMSVAVTFVMALDRKSTRLNSSHIATSRMPSSA